MENNLKSKLIKYISITDNVYYDEHVYVCNGYFFVKDNNELIKKVEVIFI